MRVPVEVVSSAEPSARGRRVVRAEVMIAMVCVGEFGDLVRDQEVVGKLVSEVWVMLGCWLIVVRE